MRRPEWLTDARLFGPTLEGAEMSLVFANGSLQSAVYASPFASPKGKFASVEAIGALGMPYVAMIERSVAHLSLFDVWIAHAASAYKDSRGWIGFAVGNSTSAGRATVGTTRSSKAFVGAQYLMPASLIGSVDPRFEAEFGPDRQADGVAWSDSGLSMFIRKRAGPIVEASLSTSTAVWQLGNVSAAVLKDDSARYYGRTLSSFGSGASIGLIKAAVSAPSNPETVAAIQQSVAMLALRGREHLAATFEVGGPLAVAGYVMYGAPAIRAWRENDLRRAIAYCVRYFGQRGQGKLAARLGSQAVQAIADHYVPELIRSSPSLGELLTALDEFSTHGANLDTVVGLANAIIQRSSTQPNEFGFYSRSYAIMAKSIRSDDVDSETLQSIITVFAATFPVIFPRVETNMRRSFLVQIANSLTLIAGINGVHELSNALANFELSDAEIADLRDAMQQWTFERTFERTFAPTFERTFEHLNARDADGPQSAGSSCRAF